MKRIILFFLICLPTGLFAQTIIPAGSVFGTWTLSGSPYFINGEITVEPDSLIVIEPGVEIRFMGNFKFTVLGQILAIGTITDSILFTSHFDSLPFRWNGLRFLSNPHTDTSKLSFCVLEKGYAQDPAMDDCGGAVYISDYKCLSITHCSIRNNMANTNGGGICCYYSDPIISDNNIEENSAIEGGGFYCRSSNAIIVRNKFSNNRAGLGSGGAMSIDWFSAPLVLSNLINYNYSYSSGAGISCVYSNPKIISNLIANNNGEDGSGGIDCSGSNPFIYNNVICNNYTYNMGGAICCYYSSSPLIVNNTICNNQSEYNGTFLFCMDNSSPTFINTILYGNTSAFLNDSNQVWLYDDSCNPNFYFCDMEYGIGSIDGGIYTGIFQNNIDSEPVFSSPTPFAGINYDASAANWSLQNGSFCINGGTLDTTGLNLPTFDFLNNPRIAENRIDIGAIEYQNPSSVTNHIFENSLIIFPNPASEDLTILYSELSHECFANISDITGKILRTIKMNNSENTISISELESGIYLISIIDEEKTITKRFVKQ